MKQIGNHFLSEFLSKRTSLVEILLTTLFLALGINLVSGSLPSLLHWPEQIALGIGVALCLLSILYFIARFLGERRRTRTYTAFLTYNRRTNRIINIREYYFSRIMTSNIDSILVKLQNVKKEWDRGTLEGAEADDNRGSIRIIREAIEYFVLRELSNHLNGYRLRNTPGYRQRRKSKRVDKSCTAPREA